MADELTNALAGLQYTPLETGWGIGAQSVAQALPTLVNPYANPMQNLGVTLGGALVASLLGYQARKEAFDMGLQTQQYANQMSALTTPEARTDFLAALPSEAISSGVGGRLSALSRALAQQELLQKTAIGQEIAKQQALADFELGPTGSRLAEELAIREGRKEAQKYVQLGNILNTPEGEAGLAAMAEISRAKGAGVSERDIYIEGQKNIRQRSGQTALTGAQFETARDSARVATNLKNLKDEMADLSYFEIKAMVETGISPKDKPGLAQRFEQVQQLYRKPEFGATLTGFELGASNKIFGKNLAATKEDLLSALDSLSTSQFNKAETTIQGKQQGPEALLDAIKRARQTGAFTLDQPNQTQPDPMKAGQDFMSGLKSKYGQEWKSKMTDNEKATLTALVNAAKGM